MADSVPNTPGATPTGAKPRSRWRFQFSLRTALVWFFALSVLFGVCAWWRDRAERQRKIVLELRELGAEVGYRYFSLTKEPSLDYIVPFCDEFFVCTWLRGILGDDYIYEVNAVRLAWSQRDFRHIPKEKTLAAVEIIKSLTHLEDLTLDGDIVKGQDLEALHCLETLKQLDLSSTHSNIPRIKRLGFLADDDLAPLERAKKLRKLVLSDQPIGDAGLAHFRNCLEMEVLDLEKTNVGDQGLVYLSEMTKLTNLYIKHSRLTDAGLKHLRKLDDLANLSLSGNAITGEGLAEIGPKPKLSIFTANETNFTDASLRHLKLFEKLEYLEISETKVTGTGLSNLKDLKKLMGVVLSGCPLTDEGLGSFEVPAGWITISLAKSGITDRAIHQLKFPNSVSNLDLRYTSITDAALDLLQPLPNISSLQVGATLATPEGIKRFQSKQPSCQIQ